ncbi:MAG TPA: AraC family transcriptional regulator [Polyangiaceae bacterium]|nr:AraC family transcriptional regulator [Polyangiaceae bacterium]
MPRTDAIFQEHVLSPSTIDGAVWPYSSPDHKPAHFHGQIEFVLVLRGKARERIGTRTYSVHPGQLIWHLPGVAHEMIEASSDLDLRVVQLEPDLAMELSAQSTKGARAAMELFAESTKGARTAMELGTERTRGPRAANADVTTHAFAGWIRDLGWLASGRPVIELASKDRDRLLEHCDAPSLADPRPWEVPGRLRRALAQAWHATRAHHDDRRANSLVELACCALLEDPALDRSALCKMLDVSEGHLSRSFQAELGVTFLEQRARLRIVRFITHVVRERKRLLEASLLAGFGSYSQLYRVFVQLVGMSPRAYLSVEMRNQRGVLTGPLARPDPRP